jgi:hypothetical protein
MVQVIPRLYRKGGVMRVMRDPQCHQGRFRHPWLGWLGLPLWLRIPDKYLHLIMVDVPICSQLVPWTSQSTSIYFADVPLNPSWLPNQLPPRGCSPSAAARPNRTHPVATPPRPNPSEWRSRRAAPGTETFGWFNHWTTGKTLKLYITILKRLWW